MLLKDNYRHLCDARTSRRYRSDYNGEGSYCLTTADSDFEFPNFITDDLIKFLKNGDMNYSFRHDSFVELINIWYKNHYNDSNLHKDFNLNNVMAGNGVINFIQLSINAFSEKGDGVIFLSPVYYSFLTSVENAERVPQKCRLLFNKEENKYEINYKHLETLMKESKNKIFLFCNPHNPIGRVWNKEEINKIILLARENNVTIVSDEIWQDITFEDNKFYPIIYYAKDMDKIISTASFGKTFNLGGTQFGYATSYNEELINELLKEKNKHLSYASDNLVNIEIVKSCVTNPMNEKWLCEYREYVYNNYLIFKDIIKDTKITMPNVEGTYLCWMDFSACEDISSEKIDKILTSHKIFLEPGSDFCEEYKLCRRINLSISKERLLKIANIFKDCFS